METSATPTYRFTQCSHFIFGKSSSTSKPFYLFIKLTYIAWHFGRAGTISWTSRVRLLVASIVVSNDGPMRCPRRTPLYYKVTYRTDSTAWPTTYCGSSWPVWRLQKAAEAEGKSSLRTTTVGSYRGRTDTLYPPSRPRPNICERAVSSIRFCCCRPDSVGRSKTFLSWTGVGRLLWFALCITV